MTKCVIKKNWRKEGKNLKQADTLDWTMFQEEFY